MNDENKQLRTNNEELKNENKDLRASNEQVMQQMSQMREQFEELQNRKYVNYVMYEIVIRNLYVRTYIAHH